MELGFTPGLLQQRVLGRVGETVSASKRLVPSASNRLECEARLSRQLELSAARLPCSYSRHPARIWTGAV